MTMDLGGGFPGKAPAKQANGDWIRESSTAGFKKDVLEASVTTPVLVDFWAPWCGPCRQLTPALEKTVNEAKGRVHLVKINVDENQALAGQMGIQSIPAVFAFAGGRPIDGFMGALPEGEIRKFIQKVLDAAGAGDAGTGVDNLAEALDLAQKAVESDDLATAEQIYAAILGQDPGQEQALLGLAALYVKVGRMDGARGLLDAVTEEGRKDPAYLSLMSGIQLAEEAGKLGSVADLEARVAANGDDLQSRFDLAVALNARGFKIEAAEALVAIMRKDRAWNEDGARRKLLELFEAWGPKDPASARGRRLLSAALFS